MDDIVSEYSQKYPQYRQRIELKAEAFRSNNSYRKYYEDNPDGAIENVNDSLDCYIKYAETGNSLSSAKLSEGMISPLAVDGNQWRVLYYVNTPLAMQENSYYCGPACVYMAVEGIKKHMPSFVKSEVTNTQDSNAYAMGTNSTKGTSEGAIRDRLTNMLNGKRYVMDYKYLDNNGNLNFYQDEFVNYVKNSLANNGPVVVLIENPFLSYYPDSYPYSSGHYIVVSECVESSNNVTFTIKDPNNRKNGTLCDTHVVSASDLYSCFIAMAWMK